MSVPPLTPFPPELSPLVVGDKIAFKEDHPTYPGLYGIIEAIGLDENSMVAFDATIIYPDTRLPDDPPVTYRATMEEVQ